MKRMISIFPVLALAGLLLVVAACASIKSIPGLPDSHPESLIAGQQINCSECHDNSSKGTMKPLTAFSHTKIFVKNHRYYASSDDRLCSVCHKASFCADCHTNQVEMKPSVKYGYRPDLEMPHRGNYMAVHKIEGKTNPASCYRCHGRANNERCIACHK